MNESSSSFIPMLPRCWLPRMTSIPVRRIPLRMRTFSSDDGSSVSRLREMQRSIIQRRSRLQESQPPEPPRNEGQELAEALFPNAVPHQASKHAESKGFPEDNSLQKDLPIPAGAQEPMQSDKLPQSLSAREERKSAQALDSNPEFAGEWGPVTHEWSSGEHSGMRQVQGSWRVTASMREKEPEPPAHGDVISTEQSSEAEHSPSPPSKGRSPGATTAKPKKSQQGENWREPVSKRPRSHPSTLTAQEACEDPLLGLKGGKNAMDVIRNELNRVSLVRRNGRLPWKTSNTHDSVTLSTEKDIIQLPVLSFYTMEPSYNRSDRKLPRRGYSEISRTNNFETSPTDKIDFSHILENLNAYQRQAVVSDPNQACLVLAGPGSGKTRVLTHRVAYLVKKHNVSPYQILAVTFTNKAAEEMKKRVAELLGVKFTPAWAQDGGPRLALGTFHSISARILRKHGSVLGISSDFMICDTSDSRQIMSRLLKEEQGSTPDASSISETIAAVSKLKNDRDGQLEKFWPRPVWKRMNEIRALYDEELRKMNQLDFDDLLLETRRLLQNSEDTRETLQETYKHVLVDEWQDTNHVQFDIVSLLAGKKRNLFVVGDADQSIYKFRGADSGNLERFMEEFSTAAKVSLEENYRSTGCIVAAAQAVIEGNTQRPSKRMTTSNAFGEKVIIREAFDDKAESQYVVKTLTSLLREKGVRSHSDVAILYRTNAQSRMIEEAFIQNDIPYRLLSGTKFYDRQEIRDLVAYLRVLSNPGDDTAFRRIINIPPRGIGKRTQEELEKFCSERQLPLVLGLDTLLKSYAAGALDDGTVGIGRNAMQKLAGFQTILNKLQKASEPFLCNDDSSAGTQGVDAVLTALIDEIGYRQYIEKREGDVSSKSEKTLERLGNVEELIRASSRFGSLHQYLEGVTLMVDTMNRTPAEGDVDSSGGAAVSLMTLHGGKGLEFGAVFIIGAEDSVIPISRGGKEDIEEERRLLYVGMTRAKKHLQITWRAKKLVLQGGRAFSRDSSGPSRFLDDVPDELVTRIETPSSAKKRSTVAENGVQRRWRKKTGRLTAQLQRSHAEVEPPVKTWRAGDSVRCSEHGRGTVTIGGPVTESGAWIEVMFADGSKHFVNTIAQNVELLYSPSS